jgi:hypothetical protein
MKAKKLLLLASILFVMLFLSACTASPLVLVDNLIPIIGGLVPIVLAAGSIIDPPLAGLLTAASQSITAGLLALKKVLDDYLSKPGDDTLQKVQNGFEDVQSNLVQILAAVKIKDIILQTKISAIITSVISTLALIESSVLHNHKKVVAAFRAEQI